MDIQTFSPFLRFPLEIRLLVWKYALPTHRRIYSRTAPALPLMLACRESKAVLEQHFTRFKHKHRIGKCIFIDTQTDAVDADFVPLLLPDEQGNSKRIRKIFLQSPLIMLRDGITIRMLILAANPSLCVRVEELLIIPMESSDKHFTSSKRSEYLQYAQWIVGRGVWRDNNDLVRECRARSPPAISQEWNMPKVVFDVEDLVADREESDERREWDMAEVPVEENWMIHRQWTDAWGDFYP